VAALLVIVALLAASAASGADPPRQRPTLLPLSVDPLKLRGSDFAPRERVRVRVTAGEKTVSRRSRAGRRGGFTVTVPGVDACNGMSAVATGSRGSRASFQFSSFLC
jgi:hypothetical protein